MYKIITTLFTLLLVLPVVGQTSNPDALSGITTGRKDGRFLSSRGSVQYMLKQMKPAYAFDPSFTPAEFKEWAIRSAYSNERVDAFSGTVGCTGSGLYQNGSAGWLSD